MMLKELLKLRLMVSETHSMLTKMIEECTAEPLKEPLHDLIIRLVCEEFSVTKEDFWGERKLGRLCWARHAATGLISEHQKLTYSELGRLLKKNHGTIANSLCQFQKGNQDFKRKIGFIRSKLKNEC